MRDLTPREITLFVVAAVIATVLYFKYQSASQETRESIFPDGAGLLLGPDRQEGVTLAQFNQLQMGMTYRQVVTILGREGVVMSEASTPDFSGGELRTILYDWPGRGIAGANMTAMFQGGSLMSKSQIWLE